LSYSNKLKDPRWQKKRLKILERDNFTCRNCKRDDITLSVHHKRYIKGNDPWEYPDKYLITLCQPCHDIEIEVAEKEYPSWKIIFRNNISHFITCCFKALLRKIFKKDQSW